MVIDKDIFEDLFVLEMANNHLGSVERGLKIISEFAQVVRFNNVRATIKLQLPRRGILYPQGLRLPD